MVTLGHRVNSRSLSRQGERRYYTWCNGYYRGKLAARHHLGLKTAASLHSKKQSQRQSIVRLVRTKVTELTGSDNP
jgi:hypothetical protein